MKRSGPPKRRTRLNARSAKREAEMPARYDIYDQVRQIQGPVCAWPGCRDPWVDPHEVLTRARGGSHIDIGIIIGLCRAHNTQAGAEPRPAECLGVVIPSWPTIDTIDGMYKAMLLRGAHERGDPPPCPWRRLDGACTSPDDGQRDRCTALHG